MTKCIVTRPSPDGERTCDALEQIGVKTLHTPLMTLSFVQDIVLPSNDFSALVFTSANGVRAYAEISNDRSKPCFYVGPSSAEEGAAFGFQNEGVADGNVESLVSLIAQSGLQNILHVRGQHIAGDLIGGLNAEGVSASALKAYEAVAVDLLPPALEKALQDGGWSVGLFSPRTAKLFASLLSSANATSFLRHNDAICLSEAVANVIKPLPFREITIASRPELNAFVDTVKARGT